MSTRPGPSKASPEQVEATFWTCAPCQCLHDGRDVIANCSGLGLRSVPTSVPDIITSLLLAHNEVDTRDGAFLRFRRLRLLDISDNGIRTIDAGFFRGLASLEELLLERNRLRYSPDVFKPEVFAPLVSLRRLTLHGNTADPQADLDYPDVAPIYPKVALTYPDVASTYPDVTVDSPDVAVDSPNLPVTYPSLALTHSDVPLTYPDIAPTHPEVVLTVSDEALDYPDVALSHVPTLEDLTLDGLTNRSFGPGFQSLRNLRVLSLSGYNSGSFCRLVAVTNDTFVNVPSISTINVSNCALHFIDSGAFIPLEHIDTVDLSMNEMLGFDNLERASYGFQNRSIRLLKASSLYPWSASCVIIMRHHFQFLRDVKEIHINFNRIETFEMGALSQLANEVEVMYAQGNLFEGPEFFLEASTMKKLHTADFSYTWNMIEYKDDEVTGSFRPHSNTFNYTQTPVTNYCEAPGRSQTLLTTRMSYSQYLQARTSTKSLPYPLPPNLRVLRIRDKGYVLRIWETSFTPNNIREIDLSGNLIQHLAGPVNGLDKVRIVNISRNYAYLLRSSLAYNMHSLEEVDLSHNLLGDQIADRSKAHGFANLTALRKLDFSNNGLYLLPKDTFIAPGTLEELRLGHNLLTAQGLEMDLTNYTKLRYIDLSSNSLDRLNPEMTSALDALAQGSNSTLRLNLQGNPLSCVCGNLDFLLWLRSTRVVLVFQEEVTCVKEDGSTVGVWTALEGLETSCRDRLGVFMGAALGSLAMVGVLVGLVLYRYRWKLRYWFYLARARYRQEQAAQEHFRYDAFISYASEDYQWVRGVLQQRLEGDHGLQLCIHQRDFLAGTPIAANIVEAVQSSRRTVCVLSQDFLDSYWCRYELQMAKMEGLHTGRDVVLLLLYDHAVRGALPREILYYIQCESYLELPQHQDGLAAFWNNLVLALQRP